MHDKRNWALAIIAGIEQLCHNNLIRAQGRIFAPSGGLNRFVREYLEDEGGIRRKIWLRAIWETSIGEEIREQLKGARYLRNVVLYELDEQILDRIAHQLTINMPRLVLRKNGNGWRIMEAKPTNDLRHQPDSDLITTTFKW